MLSAKLRVVSFVLAAYPALLGVGVVFCADALHVRELTAAPLGGCLVSLAVYHLCAWATQDDGMVRASTIARAVLMSLFLVLLVIYQHPLLGLGAFMEGTALLFCFNSTDGVQPTARRVWGVAGVCISITLVPVLYGLVRARGSQKPLSPPSVGDGACIRECMTVSNGCRRACRGSTFCWSNCAAQNQKCEATCNYTASQHVKR